MKETKTLKHMIISGLADKLQTYQDDISHVEKLIDDERHSDHVIDEELEEIDDYFAEVHHQINNLIDYLLAI